MVQRSSGKKLAGADWRTWSSRSGASSSCSHSR